MPRVAKTGSGGAAVFITDTVPLPMISAPQDPSAVNTTTTPLSSAATYTGTLEQNIYSDVMVSCQTDNTGTLYFDFSVDGTNITTFPTSGFAITSGAHDFHVAVKGQRWFRVRLVNDSGAQSYLRLYTYYGQFRALTRPLNQAVGLDTDAALTRPSNFQDEVRIGRRTGVTGWTKFGYRAGLTAASGEETVWGTTGNFTPQSAAETYTVAYNSTTDGEGTTGALTLTVYYVDGVTGKDTIGVHTLGSDGSDTTTFSAYGINRIAVSSSGSADKNTNVITFTGSDSSLVAGAVPALASVTNQCIFTTAADVDVVAKLVFINVGKTGGGGNVKVVVKGYVYNRSPADTVYEIFRVLVDTSVEATIPLYEPIGFGLSPTDVLYFVANTDTNGADISLRFSLNSYKRL